MTRTEPSSRVDDNSARRRHAVRSLGAAFAALVLAAGCSGDISFSIGGQSVEDAAVELIEGDLADDIGLGDLEATCPEVPDAEVGTEFACTATTADGRTIEFSGLVDREDHIDVGTDNVVVAPSVPDIEAAGVQLFNDNVGTTFEASAMDCGEESLVLPDDGTFGCVLTDAASGDTWDVTYTITDASSGDFDLQWALRG